MDSDHATMFLEIRVKIRKVEQVQTAHNNQLRRMSKWDCYKRVLDKQLKSQGGFEELMNRRCELSLTLSINNTGIK